MRKCILSSLQIVMVAGLIWRAAQAQQLAAPPQPAFGAASIRPSHLTPGCFSMLPPGGSQYELTCVPLRILIQMAYKLNYIDGGDGAVDAYYDLRATAADGSPLTPDSVRPMMQQLLNERFHLKVHPGKRELSGYGLFVSKNGPKLHAVAADSVTQGQKAGEPSQNFISSGRVQGRGVTLSGLAGLLALVEHTPVVDHTGLSGTFNVDLTYAPDSSTDTDLPSFFTALEEQLGLRLKPEKVSVDTLVIDHVDETPTSN
ncbi:TIGR03435 family protein [Granulicella arctica]|uniref:TIGR03435 family protein n=1 Tax=Granulicella arctica TaxID=940613 RepID=UPI0021DFE1FD|nr:TIGR03435 family protein [Granulicella arctica]